MKHGSFSFDLCYQKH